MFFYNSKLSGEWFKSNRKHLNLYQVRFSSNEKGENLLMAIRKEYTIWTIRNSIYARLVGKGFKVFYGQETRTFIRTLLPEATVKVILSKAKSHFMNIARAMLSSQAYSVALEWLFSRFLYFERLFIAVVKCMFES